MEHKFRIYRKSDLSSVCTHNLKLSDLNNPDYIVQRLVGYSRGEEVYEGDIIHADDQEWYLVYGYFGDNHKLYASNSLNSGREIEEDYIEGRVMMYFDITESIRAEVIPTGKINFGYINGKEIII